jgi:hypothetical protein
MLRRSCWREGGKCMTESDMIGIFGAIVSVLALGFAVWQWMRLRKKEHEFIKVLSEVYRLVNVALRVEEVRPGTHRTHAMDLERCRNMLEAVRISADQGLRALGLDVPIDHITILDNSLARANLLTGVDLLIMESQRSIQYVWVVTPDLEPDYSETETSRVVESNLRRGVKYAYIVPDTMPDIENRCRTFSQRFGKAYRRPSASSPLLPLSDQFQIARIPEVQFHEMFPVGNSVLYFKNDPGRSLPIGYREIVVPRLHSRGVFWESQEIPTETLAQLRRIVLSAAKK